MLEQLGWFVLGLFLVAVGADSLVKGVAGLALKRGLAAFAIGLAVVGLGSSLPELSISTAAVARGSNDLALGNLVGSTLANLGLVLGAAALFAPLAVRGRWVRSAWLVLMIAALVAWGVLATGRVSMPFAIALLVAFIAAVVFVARSAREETTDVRETLSHAAATQIDPLRNLLRIVIGLVALFFGARYLIDAAKLLAVDWGMSELVAGLTFVAVANAIPELVAALVASKRGHGELVVGAVLGSSVVNLLLVLAIVGFAGQPEVPRSLVVLEMPALAAFALALYPMLKTDLTVSRNEGGILLGAFLLLLGWQLWRVAG